VDTNGHKWTLMDTNGHKWTQVDTNGHKWAQVNQLDTIRLSGTQEDNSGR
jgi:hypothetical protein